MKPRKEKPDESFSPLFRNTRSKLYKKKSSFDQDEPSSSNHPANSGQHWKNKGNEEFRQKNYQAAIESYTRAIDIDPSQSQYYSNRSKCYQRQHLLDKSLKDAETACQLEEENIKAHYICGCILSEMSKKDPAKLGKAENRLKKALRLCRTRCAREFEEDISIKLFRLKKLSWLLAREEQMRDLEAEQEMLRKTYNKQEVSEEKYKNVLKRVASQMEKMKKAQQIPDYLICKITLMLMEDPVVSEEGFSYERKVLEEHYRLKGPMEPLTRSPVTGKVFPNHALKQAIDDFLKDNPWAFEEEKGEDYKDIVFI